MGGLGRALKNADARPTTIFGRDCKLPATRPYQGISIRRSANAGPGYFRQRPMPAPRLLVIEGNSPQTMAEHVAAGGVPASQGYWRLLTGLLPGADVTVCYPGDPAAALPPGQALEGYDGIAITGSALHVYAGTPEIG